MAATPYSVKPSTRFEGTDGKWSTFQIRIGNTPPQQVRVLVSTKVSESWVVGTEGCSSNDRSSCPQDRGGLFDRAASSTWKSDGKTRGINAETALGYTQDDNRAVYGSETIGLDSEKGGKVLDNQLVAAIAGKPYFLGNLGLSIRPSTLNETQPTLLKTMRDAKYIPSLSYSYTAGAAYNKSTYASLTLGGYDSARFVPNDLEFQFAPGDKDLTIGLQTINFRKDGNNKVTEILPASNASFVFIDSTIPDFWLPQSVCDAFAAAYGAKYDSARLKYTLDDDAHQDNLKTNPVATFQLGDSIVGGKTTTISFPYGALSLDYMNPSSKSQTSAIKYLPFRRANIADQYTLGRAFLQEAFLTVDYERKQFKVAQALPGSDSTNIIPISSPTEKSSTDPSSTDAPAKPTEVTVIPSGSSFPTGAIAGIVVAVVLIAVGIAAFFCIRRRKRAKKQAESTYLHDQEQQVMQQQSPPPPGYTELGTKSPPVDSYFAIPHDDRVGHTKGGATLTVSEPETNRTHELPSPPIHQDGFARNHPSIPENGVAELSAAGDYGIAAQLHSRSASNVTSPDGFASNSRRSSAHPHDLHHGGRAGASPEPWASGTHLEPSSPGPSLMSTALPRRGNSNKSVTSTLIGEEPSASAFQSPLLAHTIPARRPVPPQEPYRDLVTPEPLDPASPDREYFDARR